MKKIILIIIPVFIILLYIGLSKIGKLIDIIVRFEKKQHAKEEEEAYKEVPKGLIEEINAVGITHFIHAKSNIVDDLKKWHKLKHEQEQTK